MKLRGLEWWMRRKIVLEQRQDRRYCPVLRLVPGVMVGMIFHGASHGSRYMRVGYANVPKMPKDIQIKNKGQL